MPDYRALKVKIGMQDNGRADYPDFNSLAVVQAAGIDWSYYIQRNGEGWMYDNMYGHMDVGPDSPSGQRWGVILTSSDFVTQAATAFPTTCSEITEAQLQAFVDERSTHELPDEMVDYDAMEKLNIQHDLLEKLERRGRASAKNRARITELQERINRALDPDDMTPGVTRSKEKKWVDIKANKDITILP